MLVLRKGAITQRIIPRKRCYVAPVRGLYPAIDPFDERRISVSGAHQLYVEQSGNPEGRPVLFVHGGPGGGTDPVQRRFFDPERYRIILFDQRGCGKSTPYASLEHNTTHHLVSDMEAIRRELAIERFQLFGGSWGSSLSLAYAQAYPERVTELVLRGIFLVRREEIRWFYQEGTSRLFPEAFATFRDHVAEDERADLVAAYHRRLTSPDPEVRLAAARIWSVWEATTSRLQVDKGVIERVTRDDFAEAFARIEAHYFVNEGFFARDGQLLHNAHRLKGIPGVIVQGRYDAICPPVSAYELHQAWPDSELTIVPDAGHSSYEPGIVHELIRATDRFASSRAQDTRG